MCVGDHQVPATEHLARYSICVFVSVYSTVCVSVRMLLCQCVHKLPFINTHTQSHSMHARELIKNVIKVQTPWNGTTEFCLLSSHPDNERCGKPLNSWNNIVSNMLKPTELWTRFILTADKQTERNPARGTKCVYQWMKIVHLSWHYNNFSFSVRLL